MRACGLKVGLQIPPFTCDWGVRIFHYGPIIINTRARIGRNLVIYPGVVVGQTDGGKVPVIGDNVFLGAGSKVMGDVHIGNHVVVAPNAVVVKDIPDNCIVGGVPAKIIKTRDS